MTISKPIRLGLMAPLSGIVGIYGEEISWAGRLACQEINENGGLLGRPLELVIEDDGSLPPSAVRAAETLLDKHGCVALIGNLMTNSRIAVAYRVAEPRHIPYLCFSLYEGSVLSRYYFHFAALPNQQIDLMIPYMKDRYGPKMFLCGNNYEWPRGSVDAAKRILAQVGGQVVGEEYCPLGLSAAEAQRLMDSVARSGAQVLVPFFAGSDELTVLRQFAKSELKGRVKVVMTHFDEVMASHLSASERDGLYSSNSYFMAVDSEENRTLLRKLRDTPGVSGLWPRGNGIMTNFGEATYLCVKAFAQAVRQTGHLESEAMVDALGTVKVSGPQGVVTMDPATHHAQVNSYLARCQADGTFQIVKNFGAVPPQIPERYRYQVMNPSADLEEIRLQSRIVSQMNDAVCLISAVDSAIVYVNPGFERMFCYQKREILGQPFRSLDSHADRGSDEAAEINRVLYLRGVWRGERSMLDKNGRQVWCWVVITAFTHARHGEVWLASLSDITDHKKALMVAQDGLDQAKAAAEEASRAKDHFLAVLSHELRTPLSPVLTGISLLEKGANLDPASLEILGKIRHNVEMEVRLIDDLLDVTRIARGKIELHRQHTSLALVLERAIDVCQPDIAARQQQLAIDLGADGPYLVDGDLGRLQQVFWNLLKNAIKFTPEGGRLSVRCFRVGTGDAVVEVHDSGMGIEPEALQRIFTAFEQAERTITRQFGGLGLGLAICKALVEMHGGTIQAYSKGRGCGATFRVQLPLVAAAATAGHGEAAREEAASHRFLKILVVEDHSDSALMLKIILKRKGYEVALATTVKMAVEMAEADSIDLMISDLGLPDGTGYDLLTELRRRGQEFPAIALSGYGQEEDIRRSLDTGFAAHLTKPVLPEKLMETIGRIAREHISS